MSSPDEYDEAPEPQDEYEEEASPPPPPPPRRKRSARLEDDAESPPEPKPRRKRSARLTDDDEPAAAPVKAPRRKAAQVPAEPAKGRKPAKKEKAEKPVKPPVDRGKWRDATFHERVTRIRWILGLLYHYSPVILVIAIVLALLGGTMRTALTPPLIAPFYTPSVQYWAPQISKWATEYGVNPNLIATLMQIESCGYPGAESVVGAQGLFQVMPMNFSTDTVNMTDPETNAQAGVGVIRDCLRYADGDVGLAMACYNGGPSLINRPTQDWPTESQKYYTWGTGMYNDAVRGQQKSPTLDNWLQSGGSNLCTKAEETLHISTSQSTEVAPTSFVEPPTVELSTAGPTFPVRATTTPLTSVPTLAVEGLASVTPTPPIKLFLTPTQ